MRDLEPRRLREPVVEVVAVEQVQLVLDARKASRLAELPLNAGDAPLAADRSPGTTLRSD